MSNKSNLTELEKLGYEYFQEEDYSKALDMYLQIIEKFPDYDFETMRSIIADCYYEIGDIEKSLKYYLMAYEDDKNHIIFIRNILSIYYEIGDIENVKKFAKLNLEKSNDQNSKNSTLNLLKNLGISESDL